jgi:signal transduction histidine kinase
MTVDAGARDERLAALGRAMSELAHELRNQFSVMRNHVWLLRRDAPGLGPDAARRLDALAGRIEASQRLAEEVLEFARGPVANVRDAAAGRLVADAARDAVPASPGQSRLDVHVPADLRARLDPAMVERVVTNLVRNAFEAMAGGPGAVDVRLYVDGGDLVLEVADEGPGLPPGGTEPLFEPFRTTREGGTGLGLPLCRAWVEAHGGTIAGADRPGGGAVFTARLPGAARAP